MKIHNFNFNLYLMVKYIGLIFFFLLISLNNTFSQTAEEWLEIGNSKYEKGDYKGAIEDYTKALEINPKLAEAYLNRGSAKTAYEISDYYGAISDYNKAIELNPNNVDAYYMRAKAKTYIFFMTER